MQNHREKMIQEQLQYTFNQYFIVKNVILIQSYRFLYPLVIYIISNMSHRKSLLTNKPSNSASNTKTNADTHHKNNKLKPTKQTVVETPNARNLMADLERQKQSEVGKSLLVLQSDSSDINESSSIGSRIIHDSEPSPPLLSEDYKFQLPRSYIIAMTALQQAVKQRDLEIAKINGKLSAIKDAKSRLQEQSEEMNLREKQLQRKLVQLTAETKFLRESIQKQRLSNRENSKVVADMEVQLTVLKQNRRSQVSSYEIQVNHLRLQLNRFQEQNKLLKQEVYKTRTQIQTSDRNLIQAKNYQNQFRIKMETEQKQLKKQLQIQIQIRLKADKQIQILKKQLSLLAKRTVIAQSHHQQSLHPQKTYINSIDGQFISRVPLNQIGRANSAFIHESTSKQHSVINLQTKANKNNERKLQPQIPKLPSHIKRGTQSSLLSRERSTSRMKVRQNCPQLISQYRELLRNEKQLVALNYQLQIIEKGLSVGGQGRGEMQRNYQKLKRQCQQKELQIRELKTFLNDPLK